MKWLKRALVTLVVFYGLFGAVIYVAQERMMFFPKGEALAACNLPAGVRIWEQGDTRGLLAADGRERLLVFFHGNAESACDWRYLGVNHLNPLGYDVLVVEYPGYSGDERTPSKQGLLEAMAAAGEWAERRYDNITVMGYSMGTGAASVFARDYEVDQVFLFAPYDSIYNVAFGMGLAYPRFLLRNDFDNVAALKMVDAPIYIVHGEADIVVPTEASKRLFDALQAAGRDVSRELRPGLGHQELFESESFDRYLAQNLL